MPKYPESCWDVLGYRKTTSVGERVLLERGGEPQMSLGKTKGLHRILEDQGDSFEKEYTHNGLPMFWIRQKGPNCETESEQRNLSTTATAKKIEWNLISLVQIPNPNQVQKLFEIL